MASLRRMPADLYKNKFRVASARAPWWDYGWNAPYFITICTENRHHLFGEIRDGKMHLSEIGAIAQSCWNEIPRHFPFIHLDAFVVMPNHVHGILVIDKPEMVGGVETQFIASPDTPPPETPLMASLQGPGGITGANNPMLHENLPGVIRWFKGRTTFESRKIHSGLPGKPVTTTTLSAMTNRTKPFRIMSETIREIGKRTNFMVRWWNEFRSIFPLSFSRYFYSNNTKTITNW